MSYVTVVAEKRKLPVLQSRPSEPPEEDEPSADRPPWHWIGFGTVGIFGAWLPLMAGAQWISNQLLYRRFGVSLSPDSMRVIASLDAAERARIGMYLAIPHSIALALAAVAGGFLVGRYSKGLGAREASISGVALALVIGGLTFGAVGVSGLLTTLMLAVPFAGLGGHVGKRRAAMTKKD